MNRVETVLQEAWFSGKLSTLGDGHINDTYLVDTADGRFVLQEINDQVFRKPLGVIVNYERIFPYLDRAGVNVAKLVKTTKGNSAFVDCDDKVWRLLEYVGNSATYEHLENIEQAHNAGLAFGKFQAALKNLPVATLEVVIPEFLQLTSYLEALDGAIEKTEFSDKKLMEIVANNRFLTTALGKRVGIIHGDCKVNNLRFDPSDQVCCVLDLDTVMLGHPAWDWGDLARSGIMDLYKQSKFATLAALATGFRQAVTLDKDELVLAPQYVAFMLGVRFLTDHLRGDVYFKVSVAGENLARANEQFELLRWFQSHEERLANL